MADPIKLPAGYVLDDPNATTAQQVTPPAGYTLDAPETPVTTTGGLLPAVAQGAKDAFEGAGSGVANTLTGAYDLVNKGVKAIGMRGLPELPSVMREAASNPEDASGAFKLGRVGEQVGEFFVPGGGISKLGKAANFGGKLGAGAEYLTKVGLNAAKDTAISGVQSHGDSDTMFNAAVTGAVMAAPGQTIDTVLKGIKPTTLYAPEGFMPFVADRFAKPGRFDDIVGQAIDNNINISRAGLSRAQSLHNTQTVARDTRIAGHAGVLVDNDTVYEPLRGLQNIAARFGETGVVKQIDKRIAAVEAAHGGLPAVPAGTATLPPINPQATLTPAGMPRTVNTPYIPAVKGKITVNEAQELKNFGQSLASEMYARAGDSVGAQKVREELARGFMHSIEEVIPQVKDMNRNLQNTKVIRDAIESYITSNPSLVNMKTLVWAAVAPKSAGVSLLALPRVRSALAIAAKNGTFSAVGNRLGDLGAGIATQMAPDIPQMPVGVK